MLDLRIYKNMSVFNSPINNVFLLQVFVLRLRRQCRLKEEVVSYKHNNYGR